MSNERTGSDVDHTPGGSPVGKSAAAPIYRTVNIRAELLGATEHSGEHVDMDHVHRTCKAAAAMGMRNADRYTGENRADAAADAAAGLWARSGETVIPCRRCGAPASALCELDTGTPGVVAAVPLCLAHGGRALYRRPMLRNLPSIPADSATFTHALNAVANYRRKLDNQRAYDAQEAANRAIEDDFQVSPELEITRAYTGPDVAGTPAGARRTAVHLLRSVGMLGATVEHGPLWTLAYTTARAAVIDVSTGEMLGQADIAAELELTANTHRSHLNRAAKRLAELGFTEREWRAALDIPAPLPGKTRAAALPATVVGDAVSDDWRTRPGQRIANTGETVADAPVSSTRHPLTRSAEPADWTAYVAPITAARLARAAELRDARYWARNDTERAALKSAAGL